MLPIKNKYLKYTLSILFSILIVVILILAIRHFKDITLDDIINYSPSNMFLAALFIIVFFVIKSFFIFIPQNLLIAASGFLFPKWLAILINLFSISIEITIDYHIGRHYGQNMLNKLCKRYDMTKIQNFQSDNAFFFPYIVRVIGILPYDVISMYMGASKIPFKKFLAGSLTGSLPKIIITTLIGATITQPGSIGFKLSILSFAIIMTISILIYKITNYVKNKRC